jgi:hypothetical protein
MNDKKHLATLQTNLETLLFVASYDVVSYCRLLQLLLVATLLTNLETLLL